MLDFKSFMKHIAPPGHISFKSLNVEILLASIINLHKEMLNTLSGMGSRREVFTFKT